MTTPNAAKGTAKKTAAAPALDLSALTVTEAAAPRRAGKGDGIDIRKTVVYQWMADSWAKRTAMANNAGQPTYIGAGKQTIVPTANAGQLESLIRKAAVALGQDLKERIGAAIASEELSGKDKGKTAVKFAAKTGKQPYTRTKKNATPAAAPKAA